MLIIGPNFFFSTGPAAQTARKQKSRTAKSPLMQDWLFRLGGSSKQLILECYLLTLQVCNMYITQQPTITCGNDSENLDTNHFQSQKFTEFDNISVFFFYIRAGFLDYSIEQSSMQFTTTR